VSRPELRSRQELQDERCRRDRILDARLEALRRWLAVLSPARVPPEKYTCLACGGVYAAGEPGSNWRFCAACRQGPRPGRRVTGESPARESGRLTAEGGAEGRHGHGDDGRTAAASDV
jgi:hypothetical protein